LIDLKKVLERLVTLEFLEGSFGCYSSLLHNDDWVGVMNKINSMSYKNPGLVPELSKNNILNDALPDAGIQRTYRIIHKEYLLIGVYSSSKTDPGFLASRQVDSLLSNFCQVAGFQDF